MTGCATASKRYLIFSKICLTVTIKLQAPSPSPSTMSEAATPKEYVLALCNAVQESCESMGVAVRLHASTSTFNTEAIKVISSIVTYSPAPETMAIKFLNSLAKVSGMEYLGEYPLQGFADPECE